MEKIRLQDIIVGLQNKLLEIIRNYDGDYTYNSVVSRGLIRELYNFYQQSHSWSNPTWLCIDPITFGDCFYSDTPEISYSNGRYYYEGVAEIIFTPEYLGFFSINPTN